MDTPDPSRPPWSLTAPELDMLRVARAPDGRALAYAIAELAARRMLLVEEVEAPRRFRRPGRRPMLREGPVAPPADGPLGVAARIVAAAVPPGEDGVLMGDLRRWERGGLPAGSRSYSSDVVLPALVARGLAEPRLRMAGVLRLTDAGRRAQEEFAAWQRRQPQALRELIDADPEAAAREIAACGAAVLVVRGLRPELRRLRDGDGDGAAGVLLVAAAAGTGGDPDRDADPTGIDPAALDLEAVAGFPDSFGGADGGGFDGGFDGGAGDGGGGGGGGD